MYGIKNYIERGSTFLNNNLRPGNKKLATLMFYATDLCDSACKHCLIWAKRPPKHLPFADIKKVMESKSVTKNTLVGLEGGEFLLHPEAFEIMEWMTKNHPKFDLLTNCLKPDAAIEAVKKHTPQHLYMSLDGNQDTYKYMRGKDGYDSVLKVIEGCKGTVPISVMFTLTPYNDFDAMEHVAEVCKFHGIDMRVGVYNDIAFFDTIEKAHETDIGSVKNEEQYKFGATKDAREDGLKKNEILATLEKEGISSPKHKDNVMLADNFKERIPNIIKEFSENYDFLVLYDEWRNKNVKLNCYSILDSAVVHPNGDVPICQNLDTKIGNIYENSFDEIFNGKETQKIQKHHVHNCNQCWINFHRKFDVVLYRNLEKFFPKAAINKMFGYYQWEADRKSTYSNFMKKMENTYK